MDHSEDGVVCFVIDCNKQDNVVPLLELTP